MLLPNLEGVRPEILSVSGTGTFPYQFPGGRELREISIAFKPVMDTGKINAIGQRQGSFENFSTPDNEDLFYIKGYRFLNGFLHRMHHVHAFLLPVFIACNDN